MMIWSKASRSLPLSMNDRIFWVARYAFRVTGLSIWDCSLVTSRSGLSSRLEGLAESILDIGLKVKTVFGVSCFVFGFFIF